jgi:signal transduction histidine kinase
VIEPNTKILALARNYNEQLLERVHLSYPRNREFLDVLERLADSELELGNLNLDLLRIDARLMSEARLDVAAVMPEFEKTLLKSEHLTNVRDSVENTRFSITARIKLLERGWIMSVMRREHRFSTGGFYTYAQGYNVGRYRKEHYTLVNKQLDMTYGDLVVLARECVPRLRLVAHVPK